MFILFTGIQNTIKILDLLLQKLDKLGEIKQKNNHHKTNKKHKDEFVPDPEEKALLKSINELMLLLLRIMTGELGANEEFDNYLLTLQKELKDCASGDILSKLNSSSFRQNLEECLKEILKYCTENKDKSTNCDRAAWQKGIDALSIASSLPPITAIGMFLKIAKESKYPSEIRGLAAALVNDALCHMKGQSVDNKSAKTLIALIGSTPDSVRTLVYSALQDAKIIEKKTRNKEKITQFPIDLNPGYRWWSNITSSNSGSPKRLTLA